MRSFPNKTTKATPRANYRKVKQLIELMEDWNLDSAFYTKILSGANDNVPSVTIHQDHVNEREIRWMHKYGFNGKFEGSKVTVQI